MAQILADRDIRNLLGIVLIDADEELINPNGIELRLGKHVSFYSTGEEAELSPDNYLRVSPGETVSISSLERIDFTSETVHAIHPNCMLMGFITPTTTMMREGIAEVSTKIDAGFRGTLNWGLRNGSVDALILQYGEPIFKLTVFLLQANEVPDLAYGQRERDKYQDTAGISRSTRNIPPAVAIPKTKIISSGFEKLDPKKQLREAGYPFNFIGTELATLDGKFEVVSKDVGLLRKNFEDRTKQLSDKIAAESKSLFQRVEDLFNRKFLRVGGIIVGAIPVMYAGLTFLQTRDITGNVLGLIAAAVGVVILASTYFLAKRTQ